MQASAHFRAQTGINFSPTRGCTLVAARRAAVHELSMFMQSTGVKQRDLVQFTVVGSARDAAGNMSNNEEFF